MKMALTAVFVATVSGISFANSLSVDVGTGFPISTIDLSNICSGNICGGDETVGTAGVTFGGQYLYNVRDNIGLGLDIRHFTSGEKDSSSFIRGTDSVLKSQSTTIMAVYKFLLDTKGLEPYFLAGAGIASSNLSVDATPSSGYVWGDTGTKESRNFLDDTKIAGAFAAAFGFDFPIATNVTFGTEARITILSSQTYNTEPIAKNAYGIASVSGPNNNASVTVNLGYKF